MNVIATANSNDSDNVRLHFRGPQTIAIKSVSIVPTVHVTLGIYTTTNKEHENTTPAAVARMQPLRTGKQGGYQTRVDALLFRQH